MRAKDPRPHAEWSHESRESPGLAVAAPSPLASTGAEAEKLRVLVVDDEPTIRTVVAQVLRLDGHDATDVASGEDALAAFRVRPYPIVLTDLVMGGMSGLDLVREIRKLDGETLVVLMTSQASLEVATAALRAGAYDFLVKPFDDLILISAVVERAKEKLELQSRNRLLKDQLAMYAQELERLNASLKDAADRDWLTGLPNRRLLHSAVESEISRSLRHGHVFSLLMLDVDHFKAYNDRHGHLAGDEVLRGFARVLVGAGRSEHLCARYGGEEYAVLMPEADRASARIHAERIRRRVEEHPFEGRETQPRGAITVSIGLACFPEDGSDGDALLGKADSALYRAKERGRNCIEG